MSNQIKEIQPFEGIRFENPYNCNYCYINVGINVLLNHKVIRDLALEEDNGLLSLFQTFLRNPCRVHSPKEVKQFIGRRRAQFRTNEMQDAAEFLEYLISSGMSKDLEKLFRFMLRTDFECKSCGLKSHTKESWTSLKLYNLDGWNTIESLLKANLNRVSNIKKLCGNKKCSSNQNGGGIHFRTESIVKGTEFDFIHMKILVHQLTVFFCKNILMCD